VFFFFEGRGTEFEEGPFFEGADMELIELKGGLIVRLDAVALAVELEAAGHALTVAEDRLIVSRGRDLSVQQQAQIRALKPHLLAVASYQAPEAAR
jgi:hypothetical protein